MEAEDVRLGDDPADRCPRLSGDILCYYLPRFLPYRMRWALGQTCRWLSERWKLGVERLPEDLYPLLDDQRIVQFPRLTFVRLVYLVSLDPVFPGPWAGPTYGPDVCLTTRVVTGAGLVRLSCITGLVLSGIQIITGADITLLTKLRTLSLYDNHSITDFALSKLASLEALLLHDMPLVSDASLAGLSSLTTLRLARSRKITNIGVSGLESLKTLFLNDTPFVGDEGVSRLTNLTCLAIAYTDKVGNATLLALTSLVSLSLYGSNGVDPDCVTGLTNLRTLALASGDERILRAAALALANVSRIDVDAFTVISPQTMSHIAGLGFSLSRSASFLFPYSFVREPRLSSA